MKREELLYKLDEVDVMLRYQIQETGMLRWSMAREMIQDIISMVLVSKDQKEECVQP